MNRTPLRIIDDRALGSSLRVVATPEANVLVAKAAIDELLRAVDLAASRFRDDSELSRLNGTPGRATVVSPLFAKLLAAALHGARLSGGAVDPTVGSAIKLIGYETDFAQVAADGAEMTLKVSRIPGWRAIKFDEASRTVRLPPGVELDLGATAKALAADLAAAAARMATGAGGVLVSLGGDIAVAGSAPAEGWAIQTSEDSGAPINPREETITIRSGGIATSTTTVRRWTRGGVVLHHIIDPATGLPSDGPWRTATVVAGTCLDANIASTAAIVMGERAGAWLENHRLPARLVDRKGAVHRVAGWPIQRAFPTDSQQTHR
jgi:thiamine biosynthesis lipoprotein